MILNQLTAVIAKRTQVGICGIEYGPSLGVTELDIGIEIERAEVPVRLLEDSLPIIGISKTRMQGRNPGRPAARNSFGTHGPSRENLFAGTRILSSAINLP